MLANWLRLMVIAAMVVPGTLSAQWTELPRIVSDALFSMVAFSETDLVAVGADGVCLRTEDGGGTWQIHDIPERPTLSDAAIKPNGRIIAVGPGAVFESQDRGVTWTSINERNPQNPAWANGLRHLHVMNDTLIYSVGRSGLFRSTDGGRMWQDVPTSTYALTDMAWVSESIGFVVGDAGLMMRTSDAGATWEKIGRGMTTSNLQEVYFQNADTGVCVGGHYDGVILVTADGGETWKIVEEQSYGRFWAVSYSGQIWWMTESEPSATQATADIFDPTWYTDVVSDAITDYVWFGDGRGMACSATGRIYRIRNHGLPETVSVREESSPASFNSRGATTLYDLQGRICPPNSTGLLLQVDPSTNQCVLIYR